MTSPIPASDSEVKNDDDAMAQLLQDVRHKVEASLIVKIENHTQSQEYSYKKDGLDFLDVKNSILLSYMIDLVYHLRSYLIRSRKDSVETTDPPNSNHSHSNYQRLLEMKTILEKSSGLDRKLRYQIDKVLLHASSHRTNARSAAQDSSSLAIPADDPLQFRPTIAFADENSVSSSDGNDDRDLGSDPDDLDDDDLAAARQTLSLARSKNPAHPQVPNTIQEEDIYRAPRFAATPYQLDSTERDGRREERSAQRLRQKLRASEMVQTMRQQMDLNQPDQEDTTGGAGIPNDPAARRFMQQQKERTKYEEEYMIRFTTTKKEKKEQRRLLRQEQSNLSSLSDLHNLVRDTSLLQRQKKRKPEAIAPPPRAMTPKNSLQAALLGGEGRRKKKSPR